MRFHGKIFLCFFLMLTLVVVVGYVGNYQVSSVILRFNAVRHETLPVISAVQNIRLSGQKISLAASEYCLRIVGHEAHADRIDDFFRQEKDEYGAALSEYEKLINNYFPEERVYYEKLAAAGSRLIDLSGQLVLLRQDGVVGTDLLTKKMELDGAAAYFRDVVARILVYEQQELEQRDREVEKAAKSGPRNLFLICLLVVVVGLASSVLLSRQLAGPLVRLAQAADRLGRGESGVRLKVDSRDEIGHLAATFNQMAADLEAHHNSLASKVQEKTADLLAANNALCRENAERQQAEATLQEKEAELRAIIAGSATGITVSDLEGRILQTNPAFQKMLGYTADELLGKTFAQITFPDDVAANKEIYEEMVAGIRGHFYMTKRYLRKDGQVVWGQLTVSLVRDGLGQPRFVVGMVEDISVRRQLEEERIKAGKLESIGILAGGIAHDFNNILTAILGNISLARRAAEADSVACRRLEAAERATLRARGLTHQLLSYAKGGAPLIRTTSVAELIKDVTTFPLSGSNVRCEYAIPADIWAVAIDEGQMSQVLQNIVNNAQQAMPDGGVIQVAAENVVVGRDTALPVAQGRYVRISIRDHGCGIAPAHLDQIFDPYFTTKETGSGLGLATSFSIVKNHQGHIAVESEEGRGSEFSIYLPVTTGESIVRPEVARTLVAGSGRILLMDDEEFIRGFAVETLREAGYEVEVAADGAEALALYKQARAAGQPFDAVILDLTIPGGMGGRETMEQLLLIDPAVRAIVSSGYAKDAIMANYQQYGFADVVPKPYKIEELTGTLAKVLKGRVAARIADGAQNGMAGEGSDTQQGGGG